MAGALNVYSTDKTLTDGLTRMYASTSKDIVASVHEIVAKVQANGGAWDSSSLWKLQRQQGLFSQVEANVKALGGKEVVLMQDSLDKTFVDKYLTSTFQMAKEGISVTPNFNILNNQLVKKAVQYPWSGKMFSDRIWEDKNALAKTLRNSMGQSMALGESMDKIAGRVQKAMGNTFNNAKRIAVTETQRVAYISNVQSMKDSNVEKVQYITSHLGNVCPHCESLSIGGENFDGIYKLGSEPMLPIHPNCHCDYKSVLSDSMQAISDLNLNNATPEQNAILQNNSLEDWIAWAKGQIPEGSSLINSVVNTAVNTYTSEQIKYYTDFGYTESEAIQRLDDKQAYILRKAQLQAENDKIVQEQITAEAEQNRIEAQNRITAEAKAIQDAKDAEAKLAIEKADSISKLGYYESKDNSYRPFGAKVPKKVIVTETKEGYNIISMQKISKTGGVAKQYFNPEMIMDSVKQLPPALTKDLQKVELLDYRSPQDDYWAKTYNIKDFRSYACGGHNGVHFFINHDFGADMNSKDLLGVMAHETGHLFDTSISVSTRDVDRYSNSIEWNNIMLADEKYNKDEFIGNQYGKYCASYPARANSSVEDFAEACCGFVENPALFKVKYPNRFNKLEELFNEYNGK